MRRGLALLQALLMPIGPWLGAGWVHRQDGVSWSAFAWGWVSFVLSQSIHLPVLWSLGPLLRELPLLASLVILCGLAGLCEEPSRYILLRWRLPGAREGEALAFGCGHAACEATLLAWLGWWSAPGGFSLAAVVERCSATLLHVTASLLVRDAVVSGSRRPLAWAIALHGAFNLVVVGAWLRWGLVVAEGLGVLLALGCWGYLRTRWHARQPCRPPS